ncbi:MAG TPA: hypothetical protein VM432_05855 [Bdellovibrionales bacterium]|nr:hypothetical protein [Bdellovibrionales bacterium]
MKKTSLFAFAISILLGLSAMADSWYFNFDGGFGIYQPLGWTVQENGRSARLIGPENDFEQTEIFIGSDWDGKIKTLEALKRKLTRENPGAEVQDVSVSDLHGYRVGNSQKGSMHLLRVEENVIVVEYEIKGSTRQKKEGETALSSIEIKTGGIEYP